MDHSEILAEVAEYAAAERAAKRVHEIALGQRNACIRAADDARVPQVEIARAARLSGPQVLRIAAGDGRGEEQS